MPDRAKVLPLDELLEVRARYREQGKSVVQCHGCFDIVHPGHLRYLKFARQQGDVLIVSVSSDAVVGKGPDRPYIHEDLRMENLAALEFVDHVVLDGNTWAGPILEAVEPDVYVKGKEYETNRDPRFLKEQALVEAYGGRVIFGSGDVVFSSTAIIRRYREKFDLDRDRVGFFCRRNGITPAGIDGALERFLGKRVVVLADPLLDVYVHCKAAGVASEAPVLSVHPQTEEVFAGGGALIAGQLARLGAEVQLVTVMAPHERYVEQVERLGVELVIVPSERRPVFEKTRYLVDGQKVFKVDGGLRADLATTEASAVTRTLERLLPDADGLVVTDFGFGLVGKPLAEDLRRLSEQTDTPFFGDVSGGQRASILKFAAPTLVAPTEDELRFAFGDRESGLSHLAAAYYQQTDAAGLVITMGSRGALLFHPPSGAPRLQTEFLPALDAASVDNVGAGDVFLSGLVMGELVGDRALGMYVGAALAAVHVQHIGNDPVELLDLRSVIAARPEHRS